MDRSIPMFNRYLYEKWQTEAKSIHKHHLDEIATTDTHTSIPLQKEHGSKYTAMKNIYNLHSRK